MDLSNLVVFLLSKLSSAPTELREKLESFGVESFGLYHSYKDFCEIAANLEESCLVIDLLENKEEPFHVDFQYFISQSTAFSQVQALEWGVNYGMKPLVEIDHNFNICSEKLCSPELVQDGLSRLPLYYFAPGKVKQYVKAQGINCVGENWTGLPLATSAKGLNFEEKLPALFLDRDGVINIDHGYVFKYEDIEYKEEVFSLIKLFNDRFWPVYVLTNQSGIATGKYTEEDVLKLHGQMEADFQKRDLKIKRWIYSPYHHDKGLGLYKRESFTRKPGAGMALQILKDDPIDIEKSFMIGDKPTDQLLLSGLTTLLLKGNYPLEETKCLVFDSLNEIENYIREQI